MILFTIFLVVLVVLGRFWGKFHEEKAQKVLKKQKEAEIRLLKAKINRFEAVLGEKPLKRLISGAILDTIYTHGEISRENGLIGSATKRISSQVLGAIKNGSFGGQK